MKQFLLSEFEEKLPLYTIDEKLVKFNKKLSDCSKWATVNIYCKKCEKEGNKEILARRHLKYSCEIKYCSCPSCCVARFVRQMKTFANIKRFGGVDEYGFPNDTLGLRQLWHFSIGFQSIPLETFKTNYSFIKKRYENQLSKLMKNLKKRGVSLQGVRVMDFSFVTEEMVYIHYHFGVIPVGQKKLRSSMIEMHDSIKKISNSENGIPMKFESFGLASKRSVLSYLAIRSVGLYKYENTEDFDYNIKRKKLIESIKDGKYLFLDQVLTKEEYLNHFYRKAQFSTIGGLPRPFRHGSNIMNNESFTCPKHGELLPEDIHYEFYYDGDDPPPNPYLVIICKPFSFSEDNNTYKSKIFTPSMESLKNIEIAKLKIKGKF